MLKLEADEIVIWTQLTGRNWALKVYDGSEIHVILESEYILENPAVCRDINGCFWYACDSRRSGRDIVLIQSGTQHSQLLSLPGRCPQLICTSQGGVFLGFERVENTTCSIYLASVENRRVNSEYKLPSGYPLNFNKHLLSEKEGNIFIVWETCPGWGVDEQLGRFRQLMLARFNLSSEKIFDGPGTDEGIIPIHINAFCDNHIQNQAPLNPRILFVGVKDV